MESLASGGSIYLSAATAGLVRDYFDLEDLGAFDVKGSAAPLEVFELRGIGDARTRFDVSRARGLTRFVGRSDETAFLESALEQALKGPGRIVGISAQAGTGKSRLSYEFLELCKRRGLTVFEGRGLAHGRNISMLPILEMFRDFFGIEERDTDRVAREKVAGRVLLLDASLQEELPIVWDLMGISDPARPLPDADPQVLQRRMYSALRRIVRADCELEPGVILIEDLHWLDPASDAVLEHIVEAIAESRSLLVVNFRPEYRARWMQQSYYQQLSLMPLSEDALRELLSDLLGAHPSVATLPEAIYQRTGGNPFYIEEVVQSLVEDGHLRGQRGSYELVTDVERLPIPQSVQALLSARIDRLAEREKQVLQTASVIGKTFGETILAHVVQLGGELASSLRMLQDGEFLYEAALYPEHEYSFKHPLTQEVAEQSQLAERRVRAHTAVAQAYEELEPDRLDERAALLAHHWEAAGEAGRAAHWHARAAHRIGWTDFQKSFDHWQRVDELLGEAEPSAGNSVLHARALRELLLRGFRTGLSYEEAREIYERGRDLHDGDADPGSRAKLMNAYSAIAQSAGRIREYVKLSDEIWDIVGRLSDPIPQVAAGLDRTYAMTLVGRYEEAIEAGDQVLELSGGDPEIGLVEAGYSPAALAAAFKAGSLCALGRIEEAERGFELGVQLIRGFETPESLTWLTMQEAEIASARGDAPEALRLAGVMELHASRSGSKFDRLASRLWAGAAHAEARQWQSCVDQMRSALRDIEAEQAARDAAIYTSWVLPTALLGLGELAEARERADAAIEICTRENVRPLLCRCLIVRAAVARAEGDSSGAEADLRAAREIAEELGARRLLAQILEVGGQLPEAIALYEEMGATGHVDRLREQSGD